MPQYNSVLAMMNGSKSSGTAPVPSQSFGASNILGTAVPQVGDNAARPPYSAGVGGISTKTIVLVVVALIGVGYLLYHLNFEK
jgi:hypothetical protein